MQGVMPDENSQLDFIQFGVGALPEIRLGCHIFLDIFLGYDGQHKSNVHVLLDENMSIPCVMSGYKMYQCSSIEGERKVSL